MTILLKLVLWSVSIDEKMKHCNKTRNENTNYEQMGCGFAEKAEMKHASKISWMERMNNAEILRKMEI